MIAIDWADSRTINFFVWPALSGLAKREHDSLSDLLAHLAELDERELCARGALSETGSARLDSSLAGARIEHSAYREQTD